MYQILAKAVGARVETYDMEERLLAQMMFSGKTDQDRPGIFSVYEAEKTSDLLVKAYFTLKSAQYFLYDVPADDEVFRYLESMVYRTAEKEKLSTIYLLALRSVLCRTGAVRGREKDSVPENRGYSAGRRYGIPVF